MIMSNKIKKKNTIWELNPFLIIIFVLKFKRNLKNSVSSFKLQSLNKFHYNLISDKSDFSDNFQKFEEKFKKKKILS